MTIPWENGILKDNVNKINTPQAIKYINIILISTILEISI